MPVLTGAFMVSPKFGGIRTRDSEFDPELMRGSGTGRGSPPLTVLSNQRYTNSVVQAVWKRRWASLAKRRTCSRRSESARQRIVAAGQGESGLRFK